MTLEQLKERRGSLEGNILQITQNLYMLHGHKAEVDFQISELEKTAEVIVPIECTEEVVVQ